MTKISSLFIFSLFILSCNSSGDTKRTPVVSTPPTTQSTNNIITPTTASQPSIEVKKDSTPPAAASKISASQAATTALNPAHGAPGHRCDIAVGAPLSTPIQNVPGAVAPTTPPQVTVQQQPAVKPAGGNNVRLNPAHGAPGHDCNIAVGQPLKG